MSVKTTLIWVFVLIFILVVLGVLSWDHIAETLRGLIKQISGIIQP